jgi:hypothetical protein
MVKIPYNLESLIVRILISDAWLQINKAGNTRLYFKQSIKKLPYFLNVFNKFTHYCSAYPYITKTNLINIIFYGIAFTTRSYPCLTEFYNMFYENKIKIVPLDLYNLLTYEALAHWICCDGTKAYKDITLQTQSFSVKLVTFIVSVLIYKFNIKCSIHMQRNQPTIYISSNSMKKIQNHILPYFCNSMKYKLFL